MKKSPSLLQLSLLLAALLCTAFAASSSAAVIAWQSGNITTATDVVNTGTTVAAWNFGATNNSTTTVNGVTFTGWSPTGNAGSITNGNTVLSQVLSGGTPASNVWTSFNSSGAGAPFNALSASYQNLLGTATYVAGLSAASTLRLTVNSLTIGKDYTFQFWMNDSRAGSSATYPQTLNGLGGTGGPTLLGKTSGSAAGTIGKFATGNFTADATSQTFFWTNNSFAYVNAVQLSAVPEPNVAALLGGLGTLALLRRRR